MTQRRVSRTELTPVSFLQRSAYVFPDKVAVVHGARRYTYRQLEERVNRLASALRDPGDPYEDFLAGGSPGPVESWLEDEEETIAINYTSGTTGRPKGVMYSYRGAYLNALGEVIESGMSFDTRYLWTLPMFHCNGWC